MIAFNLHNTLQCSIRFPGSIATPFVIGWYSTTDKHTDFLCNWEIGWITSLKILVAWYVCEWNHYICPSMPC
jgi:hypothetical protein